MFQILQNVWITATFVLEKLSLILTNDPTYEGKAITVLHRLYLEVNFEYWMNLSTGKEIRSQLWLLLHYKQSSPPPPPQFYPLRLFLLFCVFHPPLLTDCISISISGWKNDNFLEVLLHHHWCRAKSSQVQRAALSSQITEDSILGSEVCRRLHVPILADTLPPNINEVRMMPV